MGKEIITEAATLEEAKIEAAKALGVEMDAITFEVLQEPRKKALGLFGGSTAKVKATVNESPIAAAATYLKEILAAMGSTDVTITIEEKDNVGTLMLEGEDLGFVIGRRGETLDALQYLTSLYVNRGQEGYTRVTLDTENYRAKREEALIRLANRMANRAQKTGRKVAMEPMNPYERRILHSALQNNPNVSTHSEGEEPNRHVVITLK